jgi:hypothetical protein
LAAGAALGHDACAAQRINFARCYPQAGSQQKDRTLATFISVAESTNTRCLSESTGFDAFFAPLFRFPAMSEPQYGRYDGIARRWLALMERRQENFLDLCDSGRWRHYYTEAQFLDEMRKLLRVREQWAVLAGVPLSDDELSPGDDLTSPGDNLAA